MNELLTPVKHAHQFLFCLAAPCVCRPSYSFNFRLPTKSDIQRQIAARKAAGKHGRLVSADISGGLEKVSGSHLYR